MNIIKNKYFKTFVAISIFCMIGVATLEGSSSSDSSSSNEPNKDEFKCYGCFKIFPKDGFCYTKFGGQCSMVTHYDYANKGNYVYCSKDCCSK